MNLYGDTVLRLSCVEVDEILRYKDYGFYHYPEKHSDHSSEKMETLTKKQDEYTIEICACQNFYDFFTKKYSNSLNGGRLWQIIRAMTLDVSVSYSAGKMREVFENVFDKFSINDYAGRATTHMRFTTLGDFIEWFKQHRDYLDFWHIQLPYKVKMKDLRPYEDLFKDRCYIVGNHENYSGILIENEGYEYPFLRYDAI